MEVDEILIVPASVCPALSLPQQQQSSSHTIILLGLLLSFALLLMASYTINKLFGHPTFHKHDTKTSTTTTTTTNKPQVTTSSSSTTAAAVLPPSRFLHPSSTTTTCTLLELPEDLMVNAILSFLTPFEVVTMALPTARFMQQAAEVSSYWVQQMRRAALVRENEEGGEEEEVLYQRLLLTNQNQRRRKMKMEYFRRMFLKPYQLVKGHENIDSCRVIIHGKVYDLTPFLYDHPGGEFILLEHAGCADATTIFELSYHSATAREMMDEFLLWDPVVYLGKTGTILGLFKSVASSGMHRQTGQQQQRQGEGDEKEEEEEEEEEGGGGGEQGNDAVSDSVAVAPLLSPSSFFALPTFPSLADVEIIDDISMMLLDDRRHNGIRRGEDRSSPTIVNALEALTF